jgi:ATP-dependent helicase/nuclease subunit A
MSRPQPRPAPPDEAERARALETTRSILVQAPAGSGKTDLLTRRFLALLAEVDRPEQIVAVTFTKAAAAEMRYRILGELEKAMTGGVPAAAGEFSVEALASRALRRSRALGWQLPEMPALLRVSTIDSLCRELAIRQPMLSGFGDSLEVAERPEELYHRAARRALQVADRNTNPVLQSAIDSLLLWRDNDWLELEGLLVEMLRRRDSWMHAFVLEREPDWDALRERLETPFVNAIRDAIVELDRLLDRAPGARLEAMALACFACENSGGQLYKDLAELAEFPCGPYVGRPAVEEALGTFRCLADLVLKKDGKFRLRVDRSHGFPPGSDAQKDRLLALVATLREVDGLESAFATLDNLPSPRFTDEDWHIVRACFGLLRQVAAELRIVFAEAGTVDFIEIAQIAQRILHGEDGLPSDAALRFADDIRHLLVDEFQDTSRRQHQLIAGIVAAWPEPGGRSVFVVGDPLQSIYSFRDADAELFPRVRDFGLETPGADPLVFDLVRLKANFRTQPALVAEVNETFAPIFAEDNDSGVSFLPSIPAREGAIDLFPRLTLHTAFMPQVTPSDSFDAETQQRRQAIRFTRKSVLIAQTRQIVDLIEGYRDAIGAARAAGEKFRIAVLGRTRKALEPIALELRKAQIPFRAVELEPLRDRPEVLDALALGRAVFNPLDRIAWLGVLRAPWCGLSLAELHTLTNVDQCRWPLDPIPRLIAERIELLAPESRAAVRRVLDAVSSAPVIASSSPTLAVGTWLEQIWLRAGGAACVDLGAQANLNLLWRCLDDLPNGSLDFVGPARDRALENLTAIPDPAADAACGVQLMTIHRSKGLEFEVVIVPELQVHGVNTRGRLLSWIERGLSAPDASGAITEFLIAPVQTKGAERSRTRLWVDRLYRLREQQEMRRILYVAATRAREELHLFARPEYRDDPVERRLNEPWNCLLATAWPALGGEIRARFDEWQPRHPRPGQPKSGPIGPDTPLISLPRGPGPTQVRRLPPDFLTVLPSDSEAMHEKHDSAAVSRVEPYSRHEGGIASRVLGSAVHGLLEELARLNQTQSPEEAARSATKMMPRIQAQIRTAGVPHPKAQSIAAQALAIAMDAAREPVGRWILSPHRGAASESAWSGVVSDAVRSVRVDRIFRGGLKPLSEGQQAWWIIDYKTAYTESLDSTALSDLRALFAPQLETYASILRHSEDRSLPILAGLYYPRMSLFDWWEVGSRSGPGP